MGEPPVPRYGDRSLAEVVPSLLAALGVRGFDNALDVEPFDSFCLLLIDGLGHGQLAEFAGAAPVISGAAGRSEPLTSGFPSTTAASLGSLGTGLPPGEHGLVGYTFAVPGHDRPMNALLWELYGIGPHVPLVDRFVPEEFQPVPTLLERAAAAGADVVRVGPAPHEDSGFTRSVLRGGPYVGAYWDHEIAEAIERSKGVGSAEWVAQLERFDRLVGRVVGALRPGEALFLTGDHGMVNVPPEAKVDVGDRPELVDGVRFMGGEARARHVYVRAGAEADVLAAWREVLGDRMWVVSADQAIDDGWFGPRVVDRARERIGDVVAAAFGSIGVFQKSVDPFHWGLRGHHGSMTNAEQLVPWIEFRG
jgi:hypothetical protein